MFHVKHTEVFICVYSKYCEDQAGKNQIEVEIKG